MSPDFRALPGSRLPPHGRRNETAKSFLSRFGDSHGSWFLIRNTEPWLSPKRLIQDGSLRTLKLGCFRAAIAIYQDGTQRRLVPEKLDFRVAFIPFGDKRTRSYFNAANVIIPK